MKWNKLSDTDTFYDDEEESVNVYKILDKVIDMKVQTIEDKNQLKRNKIKVCV